MSMLKRLNYKKGCVWKEFGKTNMVEWLENILQYTKKYNNMMMVLEACFV